MYNLINLKIYIPCWTNSLKCIAIHAISSNYNTMLVTMVTHQWCNRFFYNELQIFNIRVTYIFPIPIVYAVRTKLDVGHVYADINNIIFFTRI